MAALVSCEAYGAPLALPPDSASAPGGAGERWVAKDTDAGLYWRGGYSDGCWVSSRKQARVFGSRTAAASFIDDNFTDGTRPVRLVSRKAYQRALDAQRRADSARAKSTRKVEREVIADWLETWQRLNEGLLKIYPASSAGHAHAQSVVDVVTVIAPRIRRGDFARSWPTPTTEVPPNAAPSGRTAA